MAGTELIDADAEATRVQVRAACGRIFGRISRIADDGSMIRTMHIEMTPAEALALSQLLNKAARTAIAACEPGARTDITAMLERIRQA